MKKLILLAVGLFLIQACSDKNKSVDTQAETKISLAGQVYGWSEPPLDSTNCGQILQSNDVFPKLLFLNDSAFIQIIPANCGDLGACSRYYSGKYKIDNVEITLTFDPKMAVYHIKSQNLASPFVELENSDMKIIKSPRGNCKSSPYFVECDVREHLMAPKSDTLANYISFMKDEKNLGQIV